MNVNFRGGLALSALLAIFSTSPIATSQEADDLKQLFELREKLKPARALAGGAETAASRAQEIDTKFLELIAKFATLKESQTGISGTALIGYTGDESALQEKYKGTAALDFSIGTYPGQLRISSKTALEFGGKTFKDDVSAFTINYDHYARIFAYDSSKEDWACNVSGFKGRKSAWRSDWELYGFFDRLSDSFMAIDRRYEVGTGVKWEWNSGRTTAKGDRLSKDTNDLCSARGELLAALPEGDIKTQVDKLLPLTTITDAAASHQQENSHFLIGFAVSLLREFEKPGELETEYLDASGAPVPAADGTTKFKATPVSSSRNRVSVRPSLVFRPYENVTVSGVYYYKLPLGRPKVVDGRRDYRKNAQVKLTYVTNPAKKSPTFALTIDWQTDNVPPRLSSPDNPLPAGAVSYSRPSSPRFHRTVDLSVGINF